MPDETRQTLALADSDETFTVTDLEIGMVEGSPDVRYTLRPIPKAEADALRDHHRGHKRWNPKTRMAEYPEFPQDAFDADLLDRALVDWAGVTLRGQPAPCTREHKLKLDAVRQRLIVTKASYNRVDAASLEDAESDSFRPPA